MRKFLIVLFLLTGCNEDMQLAQQGIILSALPSTDDFTNGSGQQAVLLVGDSMIDYSANSVAGPTPSAGTVYEYTGGSVVQVSAGYLANSGFAGSNRGGPWTTCGINYNAATGKKMVFVDTHSLASTCYSVLTDANNWIYSTSYLKDTLYTAMKSKADAALLAVGVAKFKAIIVNLCTNDMTEATTLANVLGAYDALLAFLQADYPGSPIYIIVPSFPSTSTTIDSRVNDIIYHIRTTVPAGAEVIYHAMYGITLGFMTTGAPHFDQGFNNAQGASIALYLADTETDVDVKRITNQFYTPISSTKKAAIRTAILDMKADGNWDLLNYLLLPKADNIENLEMELIGNTTINNVTGGWTFESGYARTKRTSVSGSDTYQHLMYVPSLHTRNGGVNDYMWLTKIITNNTDPTGPLTVSLFGDITAQNFRAIGNNTVRYVCNDGTATDYTTAGIGYFSNNTWYGVYRPDSANKHFLKDSASVHSAAVASTALNTGRQNRGCRGIGLSEFFDGTHGALAICAFNGFDIAGFESAMDTLEAAF